MSSGDARRGEKNGSADAHGWGGVDSVVVLSLCAAEVRARLFARLVLDVDDAAGRELEQALLLGQARRVVDLAHALLAATLLQVQTSRALGKEETRT